VRDQGTTPGTGRRARIGIREHRVHRRRGWIACFERRKN
jgi:hypothetical protein